VYGRRRRRAALGALLVLFLAHSAFAGASHAQNDKLGAHNTSRILNRDGTYLSRVSWPQQGQAALVLGSERPAASPHQRPVPIASVAKVMTAFLTLTQHPLTGPQDGFTVTVTSAEARAEAEDAAQDQSVAAVAPGERLTERQLLEALLIPSGNNIALMLAARLAGSETRFVAKMNATARGLGMDHTTYTDPSGWDPATTSTAADQLRLLRQAMRLAAFRQIVSMASVTLPVAGTLNNTNPLISEGYAGKTGSDSAAGACLAFFTQVTVGGHRLAAAGVVLGQWERNDSAVVLAAAGQAAEQLVGSVAPVSGLRRQAPPDAGNASTPGPGGQDGQPLARPGARRLRIRLSGARR
jgi:D-alanyl-D-alanine carboxypeptidase (penicillin-binding protein 5/6)